MKQIILICLLIISYRVDGQTVGPNSPQSATYSLAGCLSCPGSDWIDPMKILIPDHVFAIANLTSPPLCFQSSCYYSRFLFAEDFGFSIPSNATILGIKAEVLKESDGGIGLVVDSSVRLKLSQPIGLSKANPNSWPTTAAYFSYGDSADLWGTTLIADSISNTSFGLSVCAVNKIPIPTSFTPAKVDHIQMTVWFSIGSEIFSEVKSAGSLKISYDNLNETLNVKGDSKDKLNNLELFDLQGRQILKYDFYNLQSGFDRIPFKQPAGIYLWKVDSGDSGRILIN